MKKQEYLEMECSHCKKIFLISPVPKGDQLIELQHLDDVLGVAHRITYYEKSPLIEFKYPSLNCEEELNDGEHICTSEARYYVHPHGIKIKKTMSYKDFKELYQLNKTK